MDLENTTFKDKSLNPKILLPVCAHVGGEIEFGRGTGRGFEVNGTARPVLDEFLDLSGQNPEGKPGRLDGSPAPHSIAWARGHGPGWARPDRTLREIQPKRAHVLTPDPARMYGMFLKHGTRCWSACAVPHAVNHQDTRTGQGLLRWGRDTAGLPRRDPAPMCHFCSHHFGNVGGSHDSKPVPGPGLETLVRDVYLREIKMCPRKIV